MFTFHNVCAGFFDFSLSFSQPLSPLLSCSLSFFFSLPLSTPYCCILKSSFEILFSLSLYSLLFLFCYPIFYILTSLASRTHPTILFKTKSVFCLFSPLFPLSFSLIRLSLYFLLVSSHPSSLFPLFFQISFTLSKYSFILDCLGGDRLYHPTLDPHVILCLACLSSYTFVSPLFCVYLYFSLSPLFLHMIFCLNIVIR